MTICVRFTMAGNAINGTSVFNFQNPPVGVVVPKNPDSNGVFNIALGANNIGVVNLDSFPGVTDVTSPKFVSSVSVVPRAAGDTGMQIGIRHRATGRRQAFHSTPRGRVVPQTNGIMIPPGWDLYLMEIGGPTSFTSGFIEIEFDILQNDDDMIDIMRTVQQFSTLLIPLNWAVAAAPTTLTLARPVIAAAQLAGAFVPQSIMKVIGRDLLFRRVRIAGLSSATGNVNIPSPVFFVRVLNGDGTTNRSIVTLGLSSAGLTTPIPINGEYVFEPIISTQQQGPALISAGFGMAFELTTSAFTPAAADVISAVAEFDVQTPIFTAA